MLPPKEQMQAMKNDQARFEAQPPNPQGLPGFGPPDIGGEPKGYNPQEVSDAWANMEEEGLEQPIPDDYEAPQTGETFFTEPPSWEGVSEQPVPTSLKQKGNAFLEEELICPGGPPIHQVNSWKKQFNTDGHGVFLSTLYDEVFIWRSLSRAEYREIMALPNTDPLQREEVICEICVLYPYDYNFSEMANRKAGIPAQIAEDIMKESGFEKASPPIRL